MLLCLISFVDLCDEESQSVKESANMRALLEGQEFQTDCYAVLYFRHLYIGTIVDY